MKTFLQKYKKFIVTIITLFALLFFGVKFSAEQEQAVEEAIDTTIEVIDAFDGDDTIDDEFLLEDTASDVDNDVE